MKDKIKLSPISSATGKKRRIVFCRDCVFFDELTPYNCWYTKVAYRAPFDYCSFGKRRERAEEDES